MVRARSKALMPVVMPSAASTDTVKAVRCASRFCCTIGLMPRRFNCGSVMGTQMSPRAWRIIMLTSSGVAFSAAITRSPSFSRPSSSVTTMIPPAAIAWIAVSTVSKVAWVDMARGPNIRIPPAAVKSTLGQPPKGTT